MNYFFQQKNQYLLAILFFLIFAGFLFLGNIKNATAASCICEIRTNYGVGVVDQDINKGEAATADECKSICDEYDKTLGWTQDVIGSRIADKPADEKKVTNSVATQGASGAVTTDNTKSSCTFILHPADCTLLAIMHFESILLKASANLFAYIVDAKAMTAIINNPIIYQTWKFVRDSLNFAFIMVLLFSAFATIFQVDKYNYKKILLTLVIMALLVNFSYPITRFIIDISNVLMYTLLNNLFAGQNGAGIFTNITNLSGVGEIIVPNQGDYDTWFLLVSVVFIFILMVTLLTIAVMLVIRAIALAILIIFSPLAFVGAILPKGAGKEITNYGNQFWDNLFKYAFFGPIQIFMLSVAVQMLTAMKKAGGKADVMIFAKSLGDANLVSSLAFFCIPIVILWIGLGMAQKMGVAGASMVTGQANKFLGWAGKTFSGYRTVAWGAKKATDGAKAATKFGLQKFEEGVLAKRGLSPTAMIEGWKARSAAQRKDALEPAAGDWRDRWNRVMSLDFAGKNKTNYGDIARQGVITRKGKELSDTSEESDYLMQQYDVAKAKGDGLKMAAILRLQFKNNNQNEYMKFKGLANDPEALADTIEKDLLGAGMSEDDVIKQMGDYSEIAFASGNYGNFGMTTYDKKDRKFRRSRKAGQKIWEATNRKDVNGNTIFEEKELTRNEQEMAAEKKASNVESQGKMRNSHWNTFLTENADGSAGDLHDMGRTMLNCITASEVEQTTRARRDLVDNLYTRRDSIKKHADTFLEKAEIAKAAGNPEEAKEYTEKAAVIHSFIESIESRKVGGDTPANIIKAVRQRYKLDPEPEAKKPAAGAPTGGVQTNESGYSSEKARVQANKEWDEITKGKNKGNGGGSNGGDNGGNGGGAPTGGGPTGGGPSGGGPSGEGQSSNAITREDFQALTQGLLQSLTEANQKQAEGIQGANLATSGDIQELTQEFQKLATTLASKESENIKSNDDTREKGLEKIVQAMEALTQRQTAGGNQTGNAGGASTDTSIKRELNKLLQEMKKMNRKKMGTQNDSEYSSKKARAQANKEWDKITKEK